LNPSVWEPGLYR